ncbi:MAG TPA: rod shape-determining protein MreD [Gaiellaceae bacterium]|nr:rod shape-determining protein MreD [Gaiellaceae bacterium]
MTGTTDALKAAGFLLVAALVQLSIAEWIEVGEGHPDVVLVALVSLALLRGPVYGAAAGFWVGLIVDTASFGTFGLTSLLLTVTGYATGRFGELTTRASAHPLLIAAALATVGVTLGSAVLHFMLGLTVPASHLFLGVLVPTLALNMLLAYPLYGLAARLFPPRLRIRREGAAAGV